MYDMQRTFCYPFVYSSRTFTKTCKLMSIIPPLKYHLIIWVLCTDGVPTLNTYNVELPPPAVVHRQVVEHELPSPARVHRQVVEYLLMRMYVSILYVWYE